MADEEIVSSPFEPPHDRPWSYSEFLWWLEGRVVLKHIPRIQGEIFATVLEVLPGIIRVQLDNTIQVIVPVKDRHEPRPGTRVLLATSDDGVQRARGFTPRRVNRPVPVLGGAFVPPAQPGFSGLAWPDPVFGGSITLGAFQGRSWLPYQGTQPADPTLETRGPAFTFVFCPQDGRERVPGDTLGRFGARFGSHNPASPSPQIAHTVSAFVIGPSSLVANHRSASTREGLAMVLPMVAGSQYPNVGRAVWWGIPMPFDKRGSNNRIEPGNPIATEANTWDFDTVYATVESLKDSSQLHGKKTSDGQDFLNNLFNPPGDSYGDFTQTVTSSWRTVRTWTTNATGSILFRFSEVGNLNAPSPVSVAVTGFQYKLKPGFANKEYYRVFVVGVYTDYFNFTCAISGLNPLIV